MKRKYSPTEYIDFLIKRIYEEKLEKRNNSSIPNLRQLGEKVGWPKWALQNASRRGTNRTEIQGGDMYLIKDSAVKRFLVEYPDEYSLRKVDQRWFLNVITNRAVAA